MKLFHGSYSNTAPVIKVGEFALGSASNLFDGIFASPAFDSADSHTANGGTVHTYIVDDENIAESRDLDARYDDVCEFLKSELDADDVDEIADRVIWDNDSDAEDFADILTPRMDSDVPGAYSWEIQRLRGRVAAHLGFDAVEMDDEHGTSYLIVNPTIIAE